MQEFYTFFSLKRLHMSKKSSTFAGAKVLRLNKSIYGKYKTKHY